MFVIMFAKCMVENVAYFTRYLAFNTLSIVVTIESNMNDFCYQLEYLIEDEYVV